VSRVELSVGKIVRAGLTAQAGTAGIAAGHKFVNDGNTYIRVTKATAQEDISIQTPKTILGLALGELVVTVGIAATKLIGPFPTNIFNQTDGMVYVDYGGTDAQWTIEVYSI